MTNVEKFFNKLLKHPNFLELDGSEFTLIVPEDLFHKVFNNKAIHTLNIDIKSNSATIEYEEINFEVYTGNTFFVLINTNTDESTFIETEELFE